MDMDRDVFFAPEVEFTTTEAPIHRRRKETRQWRCAQVVALATVMTVPASFEAPPVGASIQGTVVVRPSSLYGSGPASTAGASRTIEAVVRLVGDDVQALKGLEPGWDGGVAPPVSAEIADCGLRTIAKLGIPEDNLPSVVPTAGGGVQFEWHTQTHHVELEFETPSKYSLYVERRDSDEEPYFSEFGEDVLDVKTARAVLSKALRA